MRTHKGVAEGCGTGAHAVTDVVGVETREDGVAVVTMQRPAVRNALDREAWSALGEAFRALSRDGVRAVVFTGGDQWFSSGGDVTTMRLTGDRVTDAGARVRLAEDVVRAIVECSAPVVAAVEGFAVGAAWGLVLACDVVVASRSSFFMAPFIQRGFIADAGLAWALPRRLGHQKAAGLLLLGERLPAPEAAELGLVSRLVEQGNAQQEALAVAAALAAGPQDSITLTKRLLHQAQDMSLDAFLDVEHLTVGLNAHGRDAAEGHRAFVEKRSPRFR